MTQRAPMHYETLGIPRTADGTDIKKAYKQLALRYHPDKHGNSPDATEAFQKIHAAYECLIDPQKRWIYDNLEPSSYSQPRAQQSAADEKKSRMPIAAKRADLADKIRNKSLDPFIHPVVEDILKSCNDAQLEEAWKLCNSPESRHPTKFAETVAALMKILNEIRSPRQNSTPPSWNNSNWNNSTSRTSSTSSYSVPPHSQPFSSSNTSNSRYSSTSDSSTRTSSASSSSYSTGSTSSTPFFSSSSARSEDKKQNTFSSSQRAGTEELKETFAEKLFRTPFNNMLESLDQRPDDINDDSNLNLTYHCINYGISHAIDRLINLLKNRYSKYGMIHPAQRLLSATFVNEDKASPLKSFTPAQRVIYNEMKRDSRDINGMRCSYPPEIFHSFLKIVYLAHPNREGKNNFHVAVRVNNLNAVKELLKIQHSYAYSSDGKGLSPLFEGIQSLSEPDNALVNDGTEWATKLNIFKMLIEHNYGISGEIVLRLSKFYTSEWRPDTLRKINALEFTLYSNCNPTQKLELLKFFLQYEWTPEELTSALFFAIEKQYDDARLLNLLLTRANCQQEIYSLRAGTPPISPLQLAEHLASAEEKQHGTANTKMRRILGILETHVANQQQNAPEQKSSRQP
jgi:curved DNA-binding protein CbpA